MTSKVILLRKTASNPDVPDPYEKVHSNMPRETHMLKHVLDCHHCGAKRFPKEPPRFYCHSRKVELNTLIILDQLMRLWTSSDLDARHFCNNIRFSMATSLSLASIVHYYRLTYHYRHFHCRSDKSVGVILPLSVGPIGRPPNDGN